METAISFLPVIVNKMAGKTLMPTKESPESIALGAFFKSVTPAQSDAAFGRYEKDPPHKQISPGVFNFEQAQILFEVSRGGMPATELEKLIDGPLAITMEQTAAAQTVFAIDQLMPLVGIIMGLKEKKEKEKAAATPQDATQKSDPA
jgi:hypothetical protein